MELKFGTSGLRGRVVDMTDFEVHVNTLGFLRYLAERNEIVAREVAIAEDLRESSARIGRAVARAIRDAGGRPWHLGKIPTPALASASLSRRIPGVMITGSHIPADRNGVKFYRPAGEVLKRDEPGILAAVARARSEARDQVTEPSSEPIDPAGEQEYVARYLRLFTSRPLAGKRIAVYQHSAVGRDLVVRVLEGLGAELVPLARSEKFIAVDTEDVSVEEERHYGEMVREAKADAFVSTDGDGDRPLIVDERGRFHRGDVVGAIVARWLSADYAAIPVSTSDAVDRAFAGSIELEKTRIGSPYVIEAMTAARARGKHAIVGWEANGGFLLGSDFRIGEGVLSALPTRDAMLPIVAVLLNGAERGVPISQLFGELPQRATRAGLLDEFPVDRSKAILAKLDRAAIERHFRGFGAVTKIESIDGVRIYFDSGDIAHLRPSGNAPQFRLYAVSDTQARADEIVAQAIAEPDGILRSLERDLA